MVASNEINDALHGPASEDSLESVSFVHLSDIHFSKSREKYDLDKDLRDQLENDLKALVPQVGPIYGVLVTGDIAFGGKKEEFDIARQWLQSLCSLLRCPRANVWTVPGNHDVDRDKLLNNPFLAKPLSELRQCQSTSIDQTIAGYVSNDSSLKTLFEPLENYNDFAHAFRCDIGWQAKGPKLYWEHDIPLAGGKMVRLRGLNSVLISDRNDDKDKDSERLVMGTKPVQLTEEEGVFYVTLCHHPPAWFRDSQIVRNYLDRRAHLQLFGHEHRFAQEPRGSSLAVYAGALHPDRVEAPWEPRYHIITLAMSPDRGALNRGVQSRIFDAQLTRFRADGEDTSQKAGVESMPKDRDLGTVGTTTAKRTINVAPSETRERDLIYEYALLPYVKQQKILSSLDLLDDGDQGLLDYERYRRIFDRIQARGLEERVRESLAASSQP